MIEISAFNWVPPFAQGYVRDLRVRWALEEAGLSYRAELIGHETTETPDYRAWQPFGQVPAFRDSQIEMFESGAIVLHLAERSEALAPREAAGRARVTTWVLAALNSIEPHVQNLVHLDAFHAGEGGRSSAARRSRRCLASGWRRSPGGSATRSIWRAASRPATW